MRKLFVALASTTALVSGSALAADLGIPARAPAAYVAPVDIVNWNGFYIGAMGGYASGTNRYGAGGGNFSTDGGFAGGTIGYNIHNGMWLFGLEADGAWADVSTRNILGNGRDRLEAFGTFRGRVGVTFGNMLAYGTGGFAVGSFSGVPADGTAGRQNQTHTGWTAGGGLEWAFGSNWSAKVEYLYMDFSRENYFGGPATAPGFNMRPDVHTVKAGINYRFNWGPAAPIAARY